MTHTEPYSHAVIPPGWHGRGLVAPKTRKRHEPKPPPPWPALHPFWDNAPLARPGLTVWGITLERIAAVAPSWSEDADKLTYQEENRWGIVNIRWAEGKPEKEAALHLTYLSQSRSQKIARDSLKEWDGLTDQVGHDIHKRAGLPGLVVSLEASGSAADRAAYKDWRRPDEPTRRPGFSKAALKVAGSIAQFAGTEDDYARAKLILDGIAGRGTAKRAPVGYSERAQTERLGTSRDGLRAARYDLGTLTEFLIGTLVPTENLPAIPPKRPSRAKGNHST